MRAKIIFAVVLMFSILLNASLLGQEGEGTPKNIVKLNLGALGFTNISLQYERAIHKNFSLAFQSGFLLTRPLPERYMPSGGDFTNLNIYGFNCAPEIRFYPGKKESTPAPRGFYIAPYARFSKYSAKSFFMYADSNQVPLEYVPVDFKASFTGFGGGILFGTQFIVFKKLAVDWWILGGHFGIAKLEGYMDSQLVYDNQYDFYEQLDNTEVPYGTKTFDVTGSRASIKVTGIPFGGIRSGLCLGYAF